MPKSDGVITDADIACNYGHHGRSFTEGCDRRQVNRIENDESVPSETGVRLGLGSLL